MDNGSISLDPTPGDRHEYRVLQYVEDGLARTEARRRQDDLVAQRTFAGLGGVSLDVALDAEPEEENPWLIEGLQRYGHKATLAAPFKAGKTTFVANVVRALADEVPLLGEFPVPSLDGNIVVFDYELQRADALALYRQIGLENPGRVILESLRGHTLNLASDYVAERVVEHLRIHDASYLILDPFGRAMQGFGEENSNDDVRSFFMRLDRILYEANISGCLIPAHTGRANFEGSPSRARGATVIDDDPDVRWMLRRQANRRMFSAEGRAGIAVDECVLGFDAESARICIDGRGSTPTKGNLAASILEFVAENPGATTREIKQRVRGNDSLIARQTDQLVVEGRLRREIGTRQSHCHHVAENLDSEQRGPRPLPRGGLGASESSRPNVVSRRRSGGHA